MIRWGVLWSIFYCLCLLYLLYLIDEYTVSRTLNNLSYQLEEWPVSSKQEQWRTPRAYPGFLLKESPGEDGSQFMARGTNLPVRGSGATNSNRRLKKTSPSENISKTSTLQGDSTLSGLDLLAEAERMISNHQPSEALLLAESAYYLQPEAQKKEILLILTRGLEKLGICPKAQKVYLERIQKQRKVSSKSDFKPGKSDRIFPQKTARQKEKKSSLRRGRKNNFPTNPQEREQLLKRREQELTKICDKYCKDWKKRKDFNFPP